MNIPSNSKQTNSAVRTARPRMISAVALMVLSVTLLTATTSCGASQGALLYMMGFGQREMVEAEYKLTDEPILVLVDDLAGRVDWTPALQYLADYLGQELIVNEAAKRVIPSQTLHNIRRHQPDFEQLPARRIGELANAKQVIFIEAQEFRAEEEFYEPTNAAYFAVTVKIIDVTADDRRSTRLWPTSPQGRYVSSQLDGSAVSRAKTKDGISRALAQDLAFSIARLFYDYRPGDFEK